MNLLSVAMVSLSFMTHFSTKVLRSDWFKRQSFCFQNWSQINKSLACPRKLAEYIILFSLREPTDIRPSCSLKGSPKRHQSSTRIPDGRNVKENSFSEVWKVWGIGNAFANRLRKNDCYYLDVHGSSISDLTSNFTITYANFISNYITQIGNFAKDGGPGEV